MADAWITYWQADKNSPERDANDWANQLLFDWAGTDYKPDLVWQFILEAYLRDLSDKLISLLAAGPLEDLLARFGSDYIDRVETLARKDPKFNHLLGGVWKNAMLDNIWNRLQAARKEVW
ncbi:MAG: DUF6869 domain-containing protein [Acidobacteriota bacterium]